MMADYILQEMVKRGAESWTSPDPAVRCAIASVNVPPIQIAELETWMWKEKKIRIRGGAPSKIRLSTPYYLLRKDVDRYLAAYDEYRHTKSLA
jgi:isopenicillin-N epimerase